MVPKVLEVPEVLEVPGFLRFQNSRWSRVPEVPGF